MAKHAKGHYSDSGQQSSQEQGGTSSLRGHSEFIGSDWPGGHRGNTGFSNLPLQGNEGFRSSNERSVHVDEPGAFKPERYTSNGERVIRRKHRRRKSRTPQIVVSVIAAFIIVCAVYGIALFNSAMEVKSQASTAVSQMNAVQSSIESHDFASASSSARQL